ncbi:CFI-box-CTERM domain-containing protein [Pseudomonas aeruginosa]
MKKSVVVSASDVGKAAFCPHALSLQKRGGKLSDEATLRMYNGTRKHAELSHEMTAGADRRCFIASHAFGEDHEVTDHFRAWRDEVLVPTWWGRSLMKGYYAASPFLVDLMPAGTPQFRAARFVLLKLKARTGGEHADA